MKKNKDQRPENPSKKPVLKDLKFLRENFGGIRRVDLKKAGLDKNVFVKFSFSY